MKSRELMCVTVLTLLASPTAFAGNTWFVNGVNGNDNNDCRSHQHACKTSIAGSSRAGAS